LNCNYDYSANKDFLKDASLSGDLVEASSNDDLAVSYEVSHNFADRKTNLKLAAHMGDTTVGAEIDDRELKEINFNRDVKVSDRTVNLQPSWIVKAKTARVKMMSAMGKDRLKAQLDYANGGATNYELGFERNLEDGRDVSATFRPASKDLDVELVDNTFEKGATWTAKASVPLEADGRNNILDAAKLTLKRSWAW